MTCTGCLGEGRGSLQMSITHTCGEGSSSGTSNKPCGLLATLSFTRGLVTMATYGGGGTNSIS